MKNNNLTKALILILLTCLPICLQAQKKESIKEMMQNIKDRHNVSFIYDSSLETALESKVKPLKNDMNLEQTLEHLLKSTGLIWEMTDPRHIVIRRQQAEKVIEWEPTEMHDTLDPSKVTSGKYLQKLRSSSTGLEKIDGASFNKGFAVLSSPDVIKTLQTLPGVAMGTELLSGMYVHGGTGYDNLYLLDGIPLHQVSHLAGLFSSFNADIIDNVDFYKSGFPARFGGRMSSIVDVSTRDGDMHEYHGTFSIGLLDGRLQYEGPVIKGKSSFNVAMRRSWIDVLSVPVLAIVNSTMEDNTHLHYAFGDFNAKITHLFAPENRLTASVYHGRDRFKFGFDYAGGIYYDGELISGSENLVDGDGLGLEWGNMLASVRWQNRLKDNLTSDIKAYYSGYGNGVEYYSYYWKHDGGSDFHKEGSSEDNNTRIHDVAADADFDWTPSHTHDIRFGASYQYHIYNGLRTHEEYLHQDLNNMITKEEDFAINSHEASLYIEDNISIKDWFKAGLGLRYAIFSTTGKTYHRIEPRAMLNFIPHKNVSMKVSYTEMNQYIHNLATSNMDLPTNIMIPSTLSIAPMLSRQAAAGIYTLLPGGFTFEVEGYYKTMDHLREYNGYSMLYPPLEKWDESYPEGKGLSYGAEASLGYNTENVNISAAYTLSCTKRKFEEIWPEWYYNWNDNRHKLTISGTYKFSERFDIYAAWNFHSGNRISVKEYKVDYFISNSYPLFDYTNITGTPYNIVMPSYHRLDLGMNLRKTTKRGNESIWNISIYNAYCRMNPMRAEIKTEKNGDTYGVATGMIPIIPSFSYTLKF